MLTDVYFSQHHELERLAIHESKNLQGSHRASLGRCLAVVGERDRAVRLLLDADASNQHFYTDCLRACLLSATHHSAQAQSTIKLVATNLIAAGNIWEGKGTVDMYVRSKFLWWPSYLILVHSLSDVGMC